MRFSIFSVGLLAIHTSSKMFTIYFFKYFIFSYWIIKIICMLLILTLCQFYVFCISFPMIQFVFSLFLMSLILLQSNLLIFYCIYGYHFSVTFKNILPCTKAIRTLSYILFQKFNMPLIFVFSAHLPFTFVFYVNWFLNMIWGRDPISFVFVCLINQLFQDQ